MSAIVPPFGRMFSSQEAADYLGMPLKRLRRLVQARKIPVLRDGRLAFLERDLREWIEAHRVPAVARIPRGLWHVDREMRALLPPALQLRRDERPRRRA